MGLTFNLCIEIDKPLHRLNKEAYFVKEQPIIIYMHFAAKIFQELVDIESK